MRVGSAGRRCVFYIDDRMAVGMIEGLSLLVLLMAPVVMLFSSFIGRSDWRSDMRSTGCRLRASLSLRVVGRDTSQDEEIAAKTVLADDDVDGSVAPFSCDSVDASAAFGGGLAVLIRSAPTRWRRTFRVFHHWS